MNNTIIGITITVLVLGGLVWIARPDFRSSRALSVGNEGVLMVEEANHYDFGTISMADGEVKHQFKIRNTSSEAVIINKIYTSCMCTTASLTTRSGQFGPFGMPGHSAIPRIDQTVDSNEEVTVEIVFDPAAHGPAGVGRIQRTVTIENNVGQPVELQFAAIVTP